MSLGTDAYKNYISKYIVLNNIRGPEHKATLWKHYQFDLRELGRIFVLLSYLNSPKGNLYVCVFAVSQIKNTAIFYSVVATVTALNGSKNR